MISLLEKDEEIAVVGTFLFYSSIRYNDWEF
jgi:hypothetical protein